MLFSPATTRRFRQAVAGAACVGLAMVSQLAIAQPAADAPSFPAAGRLIRGAGAEELMRALYAVRDPRRPVYANATVCGPKPCKLRLLAVDAWEGEDGRERLLLVAAAEPVEAAHAARALIGIAALRRAPGGWALEAGSPAVDALGEWGQAPAIATVLAGAFGRGVVATPQYTAQGVELTSWGLYLLLEGRFVKVMQLETGQDSTAACEAHDAVCRRRADVQDFSSVVDTAPAQDGGLDVTQAITPATPAGPAAEILAWHIDPTGRVRQILGRQDNRRDR